MFGFNYIKSSPSHYLLHFRDGRVVREGAGLSFFYFAPSATLVRVPLNAVELPFMFEDVTRDFQTVTLQGQVVYRVADPRKLAERQDFSIDARGQHLSDDPQKLVPRVLNAVKAQFRGLLQGLDLVAVLSGTAKLSAAARAALATAPALTEIGIAIDDLGLLAVKPTPDTSRALEAPMREQILKQADDATYGRRNAAIEQERSVRENELASELVIEEKKRLVRETQVESERAVLARQHALKVEDMANRVELEQRASELGELAAANQRRDAEVRAYALKSSVDALATLDARSLQALSMGQASPESLLAMSVSNIADNVARIGEFNFTPDLFRQMVRK